MRNWHGNLSPFGAWHTARRGGGLAPFSPAVLFANNEPGVWYDPSDLTTLFQDVAGTTPVTTPGQTVALMLDKSKGLTFDSRRNLLLRTEEFDNAVWVNDGTTDSLGGGSGLAVTQLTQDTATKRHIIFQQASGIPLVECTASFFVKDNGQRFVQINFGSASVANNGYSNFDLTLGTSSDGSGYSSTITNVGDGVYRITSTTIFDGPNPFLTFALVTSISAAQNQSFTGDGVSGVFVGGAQFEVGSTATDYQAVGASLPTSWEGFHATQASTSFRPTYGIVPEGGRRNLLLRTEEFDNAAWTKRNGTISADSVLAPNGTMTADTFVENTATGFHDFFNASPGVAIQAGTHTASAYVKPRGRTFVRFGLDAGGLSGGATFNLTTGAASSVSAGYTASAVLDDSGFWRLSLTRTFTATSVFFDLLSSDGSTQNLVGLNAAAFDVWGAQLEVGSTATAYQRVSTAFDVTEAGVPSLGYLSFDGVDDFMVTPTITPGVDKVQVFAGVRKLSDAAAAILFESSVNLNTNTGSFVIIAPTTNAAPNFTFTSRGSMFAPATSPNNYSAPTTNVLTGLGDISGDLATLRIDGTQAAQSTADQGTGNYLAYPMFIGSRGGTTLRFNGHIHQLITRFGANLDTAQIESTEAYVASKTAGVTL